MIHFERPVNWRLARMGFQSPTTYIAFDQIMESIPSGNLSVFLPQDCTLDVIGLRDWLHVDDNNGGGYRMIGCYKANAIINQFTFIGLKFRFIKIIDAITFRLFWSTAIVIRSKYSVY